MGREVRCYNFWARHNTRRRVTIGEFSLKDEWAQYLPVGSVPLVAGDRIPVQVRRGYILSCAGEGVNKLDGHSRHACSEQAALDAFGWLSQENALRLDREQEAYEDMGMEVHDNASQRLMLSF